ncbi:hypothetical protein AGMMS49938_04600 [Fibrobacterales bacterium]|nr:hypothetical protein AGMMS49938_04600 [Fibrobacterales bacterium]
MLLMRAGASTRYYWGDNKDSRTVSRYEWISPIGLKSVAQLQPNGFGLYDMIGIVHESVISDFYKDWWDWGGNCDHNLSPECIYMEEISPEINYEKRTKKVYYQGLRLIRKTPKLHKLEKF